MSNIETGPNPEQKKPASFAELEQQKEVTSQELIETLRSYAEGGWGISARVVNSIIDRVKLSSQDREELKRIAERGVEVQGENRTSAKGITVAKEQGEYKKVLMHAA